MRKMGRGGGRKEVHWESGIHLHAVPTHTTFPLSCGLNQTNFIHCFELVCVNHVHMAKRVGV